MELNKIRHRQYAKFVSRQAEDPVATPGDEEVLPPDPLLADPAPRDESSCGYQEAEVIRILLNYGDRDVEFPGDDGRGHPVVQKVKARDVLLNELMMDGIGFDDELLAGIFSYFSNAAPGDFQRVLEELKNHSEDAIRNTAIEFLTSRYGLDDWERKGIYVRTEEFNFHRAVLSPIYHLKLKRVMRLRKENRERIREGQHAGKDCDELIRAQQHYDQVIAQLSAFLGMVVVK
jgi:DNA primase